MNAGLGTEPMRTNTSNTPLGIHGIYGKMMPLPEEKIVTHIGRWPPNVLLQHNHSEDEECGEDCVVNVLGIQSGPSKGQRKLAPGWASHKNAGWKRPAHKNYEPVAVGCDDAGTAARFFPQFFYCGKASQSERNKGLHTLNLDATVKPVALLEWLIKLVSAENDTILDPFCGSGSTGVACAHLDRRFIGIDIEPRWIEIAAQRIASTA
jgi:hypothetical protein